MKLIFKLNNAAIDYVLNKLVADSDSFNQMHYWPSNGFRTLRENGETPLEVYCDNGYFDYLMGGATKGQYVRNDDGFIRKVVTLDDLKAFGWETGGGTTLHVDVQSGVMEITGKRMSIRDRFSVLLCIGFGIDEAGPDFQNWPKAAPDENGFQAVDWSKFNRAFKSGFKLTKTVTTEPGWDWWHTAHDEVKAITGRWPSELAGKTAAWLLASGLNGAQVAMIQRMGSQR